MSSAEELPNELCAVPMPYIVLTGLDVKYNAVHRSIWDAFKNNRRRDRLNLSFACLPGDHQYPQSKAKRMSYDWYIPKGLLKTGWMNKHLSQVPSVVVVFFELDWDDVAWREHHLACASRVQVVRTSLHGRTTKVAVVLIQKSSPLPPGEDMIAAERAAELCSACDLSAKSLFVLPQTDHLIGYIIRLENAFYELAQTYYHTECRRVKAHKEFLNKTTHQLLFPRHQFKIAFLSELMQDWVTALKHYKNAYEHIHELRLHDSNNLELKVVGGFVNYKICKLSFLKLNTPIDAITQFQRHIDLFKPLCGNSELLFEHSAWLSRQFRTFGDLFNDAIVSEGLAAVQTQHPGFYYHRAAFYAQVRKQLAQAICIPVKGQPYPANDPLQCQMLEYFGQRPWRQGQRVDLSETSREKEGILALKLKEAEIDHCWLIIPLLSYAVSQFKKYHCSRLKRYLTIEMGKEYYHAKDYSKAITLLTRATADYRDGRWSALLTHLLELLLDCAYITTDLQSYYTFSSELLGRYSQLPSNQKLALQNNLQNLIQGIAPEPLAIENDRLKSGFQAVDHEELSKSWDQVLSHPPPTCTIEVNNLLPFVECKVYFSQPHFPLESCIKLYVCLYVSCPSKVQFSELTVGLSNSIYDQNCVITDCLDSQNVAPLYFEPNSFKVHEFEFPIQGEDLNKAIHVHQVSLKVNSKGNKGAPLVFQWFFTQKQHSPMPVIAMDDSVEIMKEEWENIPNRSSAHVVERQSRLDIDVKNEAPALVGEIFPVHVHISCKESSTTAAENVLVLVSLKPGSDDAISQGTSVSIDMQDIALCTAKTAELSFGPLSSGENATKTVYIRSQEPGTLRFSFQTTYQVHDVPVVTSDSKTLKSINCTSTDTAEVSFDVLPPFNFNSHITLMTFESTSTVNTDESFLVLTTLSLGSEWPIKVLSAFPQLVENGSFQLLSKSDCTEVNIFEGESVTDCLNLKHCRSDVGSGVMAVGFYVVQWRRADQRDDFPPFTTTLKLPSVTVKSPPLVISANIPAFGILRKPTELQFFIENRSQESKQLEISYGHAEAFMFSGPKQANNFLPPTSSFSISFSIIPLALGFQALPQLKVLISKSLRNADENLTNIEELDVASLPSHLTVKPAEYLLSTK